MEANTHIRNMLERTCNTRLYFQRRTHNFRHTHSLEHSHDIFFLFVLCHTHHSALKKIIYIGLLLHTRIFTFYINIGAGIYIHEDGTTASRGKPWENVRRAWLLI